MPHPLLLTTQQDMITKPMPQRLPVTATSTKLTLADGCNNNVNKDRDELKSPPHSIIINLTNLEENKQDKEAPFTILHTAVATVNGHKLKLLLDAGADASATLKNATENLVLDQKKPIRY